jgi:flagellin
LDVTVDADGTTFSMVGINLGDPTYTSATNMGVDSWKLTDDAYMLSKDGYKANAITYKSSADLWRSAAGTWSATNNGGTKFNSGSYISEDISTVDTSATSIAKDNFIAGAAISGGFKAEYDDNQLEKTAHGLSTGDALSFHTSAPAGLSTTATYYVNKADANNITVHTTKADANAGINRVDLTRTGISAAKTNVASSVATVAVAQQDIITITAGNHVNDTFEATVNGNKTAAIASVVGNNNTTAANLATAINGLAGVTASAVGNVITITATTPGTPLTGATSVALDNSDGVNDQVAAIQTGGAGASVANVAGSAAKFTKADHGLSVGDRVTITKNAPTAFTALDTYYVQSVSGNDFTLSATSGGAALAPTSAVANMEFTTDTLAGTASGTVGTPSGTVTATSHGLVNGDRISLNNAHGGKTAGTYFFVNRVDANSFKIYDTAVNARAGGATGLQTFNASGAVRFSLIDSDTSVAILNKSDELKKGMYTTNNPVSTGEDTNAVLAKSGEVININKATQDISSFATELDADYDNTNLKSVLSSQIALSLVKLAITQVATDRARLGAVQSRLNFTNEQLAVTKENLSAAISRIADVDVAEEATAYARYQILVQSGTEMLKQANQLPQSALNLLR